MKTRSWRVLHVLAPSQFGGLERVVAGLASGHRARGHDVSAMLFVDSREPLPPLAAELRERGVNVVALALPARSYLGQARALKAWIRDNRPDVVHSHGYHADVIHGALATRIPAASMATVHGFTGGGLRNRLYEWLQLRSCRRFGMTVAVSAPIRERLLRSGVRADRSAVVRNAHQRTNYQQPTDARRALGVGESAFSIGWIGRISAEKGLDVLLRSLPTLRDLPYTLTVIGDGAERASAEKLIRELGVADRVRLAGVLGDAARLLPAFDLVVLSSRTEGTPIILLEAMAAGVPVVATAVGGIPDVVGPEQALLVPAEDPASLAGAIRASYTDPRARQARAERAKAKVEAEFAMEPWLEAYEALYSAVCGRMDAARA